ncbi:MAG: hypothetical protein H7Y36_10065 [Armatimonadetes bacterium]|nr:hypothetical protein [Akkermansiaceae bacterium]
MARGAYAPPRAGWGVLPHSGLLGFAGIASAGAPKPTREFAEGSAILATLPRLSPLPGSTPDAVELSGTYDAAAQKTDLAWSEVADGNVTELELRATAGPEFDPEDETILATFAPSDPRVWTGSFGLLVPGSAASFKLYSITAQGNERGSNAVTVVRPG